MCGDTKRDMGSGIKTVETKHTMRLCMYVAFAMMLGAIACSMWGIMPVFATVIGGLGAAGIINSELDNR